MAEEAEGGEATHPLLVEAEGEHVIDDDAEADGPSETRDIVRPALPMVVRTDGCHSLVIGATHALDRISLTLDVAAARAQGWDPNGQGGFGRAAVPWPGYGRTSRFDGQVRRRCDRVRQVTTEIEGKGVRDFRKAVAP
jgi:hypothetical protein